MRLPPFAGAMLIALAALPGSAVGAQQPEWSEAHAPVRIFGNTYYVGTVGVASILITSPQGHVLIDGTLAQNAPLIARNIETLGFHLRDVKVILNSHAHYDHAAGIAELQRQSGATVEALPWSGRVISSGKVARDDPQYGIITDYPGAANVRVIHDGDTVRVGPLALVAHRTAGHTPDGTTWSWRSCERGRCIDIVYADSQSPVSADDFFFTRSKLYSTGVEDFQHGFDTLERLRCDILITPHPGASSMWERLAKRDSGDADALVDPGACRRLAATGREALAKRLEQEKQPR